MRNPSIRSLLAVLASLALGCRSTPSEPPPVPPSQAALEAQLRAARAELAAAPDSEEAIIWVGRRTAYLGDYEGAIDVYTHGLVQHPASYRLLRHRGHRWISLREYDRAVEDLALAAARCRDLPDAVEPDGAPNELGIPRGTDKTSIYYHLGLAHYLRGEFAAALAAYDSCRALSPNDDMSVAADYWRVLCLRRLGRDEETALVLAGVEREMDVIENHQYHQLLLYFRGALSERELLLDLPQGVASPTVLYGYGTWSLLEGNPERARAIYQQIVEADETAAFGRIAAESELARMVKGSGQS